MTQSPDLSLLAFEQTKPWEMCLALRGEVYALIYTPTGRTLDSQLGKLAGENVKASWFDPRTGGSTPVGEFQDQGRRPFDPPGDQQPGHDWVLVLESTTHARNQRENGPRAEQGNSTKTTAGIRSRCASLLPATTAG